MSDTIEKSYQKGYDEGQEVLITHVKETVNTILERGNPNDLMFDVVNLLQNIKPKQK